MVSQQILAQLRAFAEHLDHDVPGRLTGLYAVGSVALGDFRAPLSNLDVVAVADDAWDEASLSAVRTRRRDLRTGGEPPRIACVTWAELAANPEDVEAPGFVGGRAVPGGDLVNPLTWAVLRTAGVCVRGPEYPELGAGDLRAWAQARLTGHWGTWLERVHLGPLILRRRIAEAVLEVARLAQVVGSGRVVSKLEAGEALEDFGPPNQQRILKDATGYRQGQRMSMYWGPYERRRHALAYIRSVVDATRSDRTLGA